LSDEVERLRNEFVDRLFREAERHESWNWSKGHDTPGAWRDELDTILAAVRQLARDERDLEILRLYGHRVAASPVALAASMDLEPCETCGGSGKFKDGLIGEVYEIVCPTCKGDRWQKRSEWGLVSVGESDVPVTVKQLLDPDNLDPKALETAATALGAIVHDDLEWEELGPLFQDEERLRAKTAIRAYLEAAADDGE
jgi:hypothetical protein